MSVKVGGKDENSDKKNSSLLIDLHYLRYSRTQVREQKASVEVLSTLYNQLSSTLSQLDILSLQLVNFSSTEVIFIAIQLPSVNILSFFFQKYVIQFSQYLQKDQFCLVELKLNLNSVLHDFFQFVNIKISLHCFHFNCLSSTTKTKNGFL